MTVHIGSWGTPDFGITEAVQKYFAPNKATTAQGGSNLFGSNSYAAPSQPQTNSVLGANTAFIGPAIPTSNRTTGGGSSSLSASSQGNFNQGVQNVQNQGNQGLDFIEQDYNNQMGQLSGAEQGIRGQAANASGQIDTNAASTQNELQNAQSGAQQDIQNKVQTAQTGGQSAMQQARDLFRQTQQQNIAQLSAMGISSSSVSEALAERLGVETARRIAGVTGSVQEVQQNAQQELQRTNAYYQGKKNDLNNWVNDQKANIQQSLMAGLNQINSARNQAATDKSRSRAELINNVQNAIQSLTAQQQQFQQSLDQWAQQKSSVLQPLVTDPNFIQSLQKTTDTLNQNFAPTGFGYAPQFSQNGQGQLSGQVNYGLNKTGKQNPYDPNAQPDQYQLWQIQNS